MAKENEHSDAIPFEETLKERSKDRMRVLKEHGQYVTHEYLPRGDVFFIFSELAFSKHSVDCVLSIEVELPGELLPPYSQRIDLRSASARAGLVTSLNSAYGNKKDGYNWVLLLNAAFNKVIEAVIKEQQPQSVAQMAYEEVPFLYPPFLQTGVTNLLFAQSEAGKTWFALRLAASVALGAPFMTFPAQGTKKKVLYIDYEDVVRVFANRLHSIASGMQVEFQELAERLEYYKPVGSLRNNVEHLKAMVAKHGYDLIIIDAGGDAAGGSPSDEEKVLDLFNALEEIPCTKLVLHHEPKNIVNEAAAFYGSMYWKARSRVAWRLEVEHEDANRKLIKASIQKKSNLGWVDPYFYELIFDSLAIFEEGADPAVKLSVRMEHLPTARAHELLERVDSEK